MDGVQQIARAYWDAEESRDIGRILEHFLPDATWTGPGRVARGHDELRAFYDESIADYPGLEVRIRGWYGSHVKAALEWCASFTDVRGGAHQLHGTNLIECREGRIASLTTYFDPAELDVVLGSPHEPH